MSITGLNYGGKISMKILSFFLFLSGSLAFGQMAPNITTSGSHQDKVAAGTYFSSSTVEYDVDGDKAEVKRRHLGVVVAYGMDSDLQVFGQFARLSNVEIEDKKQDETLKDGDGYIFGGGLRSVLNRGQKFTTIGYGGLLMTKEKIENHKWEQEIQGKKFEGEVDIEHSVTDIHAGAIFQYHSKGKIAPYGGIDFVFDSSGDVERDSKVTNVKNAQVENPKDADSEREELMTMKLGANIEIAKNAKVVPELSLIGEQTFSLMGAWTF